MNSLSFQIIGFVVTIILVLLMLLAFGRSKAANGKTKYASIKDLIRAVDGTYSLAKLQAALWAFFILSFQVSILCAFIFASKDSGIYWSEYRLILSEQILFLLGLSLGSLLIVNQITINQLAESKISGDMNQSAKSEDLIATNGRLDISKFQMLIWTVLALTVFTSQSHLFLYNLYDKNIPNEISMDSLTALKYHNDILAYRKDLKTAEVKHLFWTVDERKNYNLNAAQGKKINEDEDMPTVAWTFIILMGLSQGTYIYNKLVPTSKIKDEKENRLKDLNVKKAQLEGDVNLLMQKITAETNLQAKSIFETEKRLKEIDKENIAKQIEELTKELSEADHKQ